MRLNVKALVSCIIFVFLSTSARAKNYYFSSILGDDNRSSFQAQNKLTPWKTLTKLNSFFSNIEPGDSILFKKGEVFFGSIIIKKSGTSKYPIVLTTYGIGEQPQITSLVNLTNWIDVGNGIYECVIDSLATTVRILLLNNKSHEMGRYPNSDDTNKGYLTLESHSNNSSITDTELASFPNWTGAEVVIRKTHWIIDRHRINAHSGNTLYYTANNSLYNPTDKFGYFIQNDVRTLDQIGEWYFNPLTKKLDVFFGQNLPLDYHVQATTIENLVEFDANNGFYTNIIFKNLYFKGANANAFLLNNGKNCSIKNCIIEFSGEDGVKTNNLSYLTIENCAISKSNNNAIYLGGDNNHAIVYNNKIDSTNIFSGMGENGDGNGIGIYSTSNNNNIARNRILNTGYIGVSFNGDSTIIKNNFIDTFCLVKDDGSGIYTWTGYPNKDYYDRKIIDNIIINGVGTNAGTTSNYLAAEGIYLDDNASGILVSGNTVSNMGDNGVLLHNARSIIVNNNTIYNSKIQFAINHDHIAEPTTNVIVNNNIFFSKLPSQITSSISSIDNEIKNIGKLDSNYYNRPTDEESIINTQYVDSVGVIKFQQFSLDGWIAAYNQDQFSKKSPISIPQYKLNNLIGANKFPNGTFDTSISGITNWSPANNSKALWVNNKLDGGALQLTNGDQSILTIATGAVDKIKKYILRFSILSDKEAFIDVFLRQYNTPYITISSIKTLEISTLRKNYEILFAFPESEMNSCLVFNSQTKNITYWLDNISLYEADATLTDLNQYIKFSYNSSNTNKTIKLNNTYVDAKNISYSDSIVLKPFSSVILMRNDCFDLSKPVIKLK